MLLSCYCSCYYSLNVGKCVVFCFWCFLVQFWQEGNTVLQRSLVELAQMASLLSGDPSHHGFYEDESSKLTQDKLEEGGRWYFSRKEIEQNSPSRRDGIDWKKESYLRKSYCTFLQDLGMRLKVWVYAFRLDVFKILLLHTW